MRIQLRGRHNDREWCSLSPEGPGPKAHGNNVHDTCFPKRFWVPSNIVKYDSKTNPSVWLEDYHLSCRAGGADSDLLSHPKISISACGPFSQKKLKISKGFNLFS
jgi:hypothetical protein